MENKHQKTCVGAEINSQNKILSDLVQAYFIPIPSSSVIIFINIVKFKLYFLWHLLHCKTDQRKGKKNQQNLINHSISYFIYYDLLFVSFMCVKLEKYLTITMRDLLSTCLLAEPECCTEYIQTSTISTMVNCINMQ